MTYHMAEWETDSRAGATFSSATLPEDRERARRLAEYLKCRGWSVWWDRDVPVGRPFDEVIEEAIRQAHCVVVMWSEAAVASRWVRSEASEAARREILVPVLVEDVAIPLEFRLFQALDLKEWAATTEASALEGLHNAVTRVAGESPAPGTNAGRGVEKSQKVRRHRFDDIASFRPRCERLVLGRLSSRDPRLLRKRHQAVGTSRRRQAAQRGGGVTPQCQRGPGPTRSVERRT